tara:strand:- start:4326 stop:5234 length:909 start_codon:yes stop_codon:yes gene_type:complete
MQLLISGGTGFIGTALVQALTQQGHHIIVLTRGAPPAQPGVRFVNSLDAIEAREQIDAVVNLAGASLAAKRWTASYRRELLDSRLDTTRDLVALIGRLERTPPTLLSASAVGYYGHHGDEKLAEDATVNACFSQQLCEQWEAQAQAASAHGTRVCLLRFGVVLDKGGGALSEMTRSFRFGVGTWAGSGNQWLSWVHRADLVRAVLFLLHNAGLAGPVNITAPAPVTARGLGEALCAHFTTLFRMGVPGPVMRLLLGQMADELLLNGQRVVPAVLEAAGFHFLYPQIDDALAAIYGDQPSSST